MRIQTFKEINLKNEQKYISYLFRNPQNCFDLPLKFFFNANIISILKSIQKLQEKNLEFCFDEILIILSEINSSITKDQLENLQNAFTDFSNIEETKRLIKETYLRENINKQILEEILVETTKAGNLDLEKLKKLGNDLLYKTSEINDKIQLKSAEDLKISYIKILEERQNDIKRRTLGYKPLDDNILRPAQDGEMTAIVSLKGMLKSAFVKNIENRLVNKRIPVLSINTEMTEESSVDRLVAMRGGFTLWDLTKKEKEQELYDKILNTIERLSASKYYEFTDESNLSLDDLDALIYKAKSKFREKDILTSKDEYIFITIDLLEMLLDFSGKDAYKIIESIDKLHRICKKHKSHILYTLQANENKIRSMRFKKPEDLDYYKIGIEDVFGGSGYAGRSRVVLSLQRPKHLKMMFFPDRNEEWEETEEDIIKCNCVKQNDGKLFFTRFVFDETFRIMPRLDEINGTESG